MKNLIIQKHKIMNKENNILLAEFLGWENLKKTCLNLAEDTFIIDSNLVTDKSYFNLDLENGSSVCTMCADYLKFHNDWNWLILVIEKIESFTQVRRHYRVDFFKCEDSDSNYNANIYEITNEGRNFVVGCDNFYKSKIEATYNACVEFIKWYNIKR